MGDTAEDPYRTACQILLTELKQYINYVDSTWFHRKAKLSVDENNIAILESYRRVFIRIGFVRKINELSIGLACCLGTKRAILDNSFWPWVTTEIKMS